ncbi:MAG TPA: hypothetical protein VF791_05355 [Pyrinomonadaceae bacterium]
MKNPNLFYSRATSLGLRAVAALACLVILSQSAGASGWNGIEPLKSRRADVERILGKPLSDPIGETGTLHFKVNGGTVTVAFVNARFIANKKLSRELEGTVLQIVLQHENSSDTPESMNIAGKSNFEREATKDGNGEIYRNLKDGIVYTFINGKLRTTRFTPSATQLGRARRG